MTTPLPFKVRKASHLHLLPVGSAILLIDQGYTTVAAKNLTYGGRAPDHVIPRWFTSDNGAPDLSAEAIFDRWQEALVIHIPTPESADS